MTFIPSSCSFCGMDVPEKLTFVTDEIGSNRGKSWYFCNVCLQTDAAKAVMYSEQYRDSRQAIRMVAQCTNLILRKLEKP